MKSKKLLFYFLLLFILNKNYILSANEKVIILPLKKPDLSKIKEIKNVNDTIKFIFSSPLIAELEIGSPSQKVNFIIRPKGSLVYFASSNHTIQLNDDETTKINFIKYNQLNTFDENKSTSFKYEEEQPKIPTHFFYNFNKGVMLKDYLKFNDNKIELNTNFILAYSLSYDEPGAVGLQIVEKSDALEYTPTILYTLKKNNITENYKWFIYFDKNQKNDYLVIGCEPYEFINPSTKKLLYKNFDIKNDYFAINDRMLISEQLMQIKFNNIYNKDINYNETYEDGNLYYDMGINIGTENYQKFIENYYLKTFINNKKCFKDIFSQRINYIPYYYYYYYCEESIYNDLKNNFSTIYFKSTGLNNTFELNFNDLFVKHNDYIFFLVAFSNQKQKYWELGIPFTKKYQFAFDFESKQIMYYKGGINENDNQKSISKYFILVILIVLLGGILIGLGIFLGKKIYGLKRKQRANELDEDFEYKEKKDCDGNKDDLLNINSD